MTRDRVRLLCCAAITVVLCAAGPEAPVAPAPAPTEVIAEAGSVTITVADIQKLLDHVDPATRTQLLHNHASLVELVRSQLARQELLAEAKAKKWDQDPDVAYRANLARDTVIVDSYLASLTQPDASYPSDDDVQTAYEANKTRFVQPRQYHLAQIFLAVPPNAPAQANDDAQKKLRELKQSLSRPHADFAQAARRVSQDKASADHGGEVGWAREDQLAPAIRDAVTGLPDDAISDPIHTPDGWHLIKLLGTKPATTAPLEEVKPTVVRLLRQQKAADNARAYVQQMQVKTPVEINEIALSHLFPQ